jgi:hypothetical protein
MYNNEALHNNMRKAAAEVAHVEFSYERFLEEHKTFFRVIES